MLKDCAGQPELIFIATGSEVELAVEMCIRDRKQLDPQNRAHRPIIDELQERMADKMYVNFSLFQSMPDAWGIDQLFPVLPLEGLDQVPERRAVLLDITCDSDGAIDHYIDGDGIATTMPDVYKRQESVRLYWSRI